MKKIIFLALILFFAACKTDVESKFDKNCEECKTVKYISSQRIPSECYKDSRWKKIALVYKFEYEGHVYIQFLSENANIGQGIVHDPDCPCRNNQNFITTSNGASSD